MSKRSVTALQIELRPSRLLGLFLAVIHLVAIACLLQVAMPAYITGLLIVAIILSAVHYFRTAWQVRNVRRDHTGQWYITFRDSANEVSVDLKPGNLLTRHLVILNFACIKRRSVSVVIAPDSIDEDSFRRLRMQLRVDRT